MAGDGPEYAVPRYRDPERAARIVAARQRGETRKAIAAREGMTPERVGQICRDAGLTKRRPTTPLPKPCAECEKLMVNRSAAYCSRKCTNAADPIGKHFYERRRDSGATWREIAGDAPDSRSDPAKAAQKAARRYARANGLPWPLPNLARSERMARRDEEGMAEVRQMVEHEGRVRALRDALPKDRAITKAEVERFLVELYRTGMKFSHIAQRTNCSHRYVKSVVQRLAPELLRPREGRGKKKPPLGLLLDIPKLRNSWRFEHYRSLSDPQGARMFMAWAAGTLLRDIG